jgi:peptidoglycan/LPS O-acetylase OafA/YrhL
MSQPAPGILKTKHHFEILDGLRGIAAISVVVFHFREMASINYAQIFIGHGFLAVDFFFCLSGFVIAYAYDDRISKMGIWQFFKSRIIRLHPMVIFGSVLGLLAFLFDPFGGHPELYRIGRTLLIFLCSILLIPFPVMTERAFNLFSFNAPAWSLFWEYIANIFYALVLYKINRRWLIVLFALAAALLCVAGYRAHAVSGGWSGGTFWDGGARIFYSFLAGLIIYRYNLIIKSNLGFISLSILLVLAFVFPYFKIDWMLQLLTVLVYFPLLISLGAGATLTGGFKKICVFFGNISYPLYMTHYAVIWMFGNYYNSHKLNTNQLFSIIIPSTILLLGFAYLVMVLYDVPIRKWLSGKRKAV